MKKISRDKERKGNTFWLSQKKEQGKWRNPGTREKPCNHDDRKGCCTW
jgi:hypothetical protein